EGTGEAARALGTHLREGPSLELQRLEIDFLFRLAVPDARLALFEAMTDGDVDPALRLDIAERLHATGGFDRVRDARAALERIRSANASLAARVDRLLAALKGIREDPSSSVAPDTHPPAAKKKSREKKDDRTPGRVNLIVAGATAGLLALLLGWKRGR
ncbi:MAG TPA: hypothetical protein VJU16_04380, partial [Planctomycetota bacterium]|nr:hypothetical protein [Planctomycetota bacterium]